MGEALIRRTLTTAALLGLLYLLGYVRLPTLEQTSMQAPYVARTHVTALGISPWAVGFFFVELSSFVFPKSRKLRRAGTSGRKKLNRFAFGAGILLAFIQASGVTIALSRRYWLKPGLQAYVGTVVAFVIGAVVIFLIARGISRWGICNGFCLFALLPMAGDVFRTYRNQIVARGNPLQGIELLLSMIAVGALVKVFLRGTPVVFGDSEGQGLFGSLAAFPQGIEPLNWTFGLLALVSQAPNTIQLPQTPVLELCTATLIAGFSIGSFYLFSSRKRLASNLPAGALPREEKLISFRSLAASTTLLVVLGTVLNYRSAFLGFTSHWSLPFYAYMLFVAFLLDVINEGRFRYACRDKVASLIEMDNVHGAAYLRAVLASNGIKSVARAFNYRSLFFFFDPIVKMELLVPAAELERAQEIIQMKKLEVV